MLTQFRRGGEQSLPNLGRETNIESKQIRRTALRHAWLSFPLGAVIIAASINLVSGLANDTTTSVP